MAFLDETGLKSLWSKIKSYVANAKIPWSSITGKPSTFTPSSHTHDYLPLAGGTLTGNLSGKYITGTWLQSTAASNLGSNSGKIAVLDGSGWVYYRTPAQILSDIGAAASSHNHDSVYAKTGHNHDSSYAAKSHKHNSMWNTAETFAAYVSSSGHFCRNNNNTQALGTSSLRWASAYLVSAANVSSDRNLKEDFSTDFDKYIEIFDMVEPISFLRKDEDAATRKRHTGYIAQDFEEALKTVGLSERDFNGFSKEVDEDGNVYYGLCHEEFISILHAKMNKEKLVRDAQIESIIERLEFLEAENKRLLTIISNQQKNQ